MLNELTNKTVVVAGLGKTGQATLRFLRQFDAMLKVWDTRANLLIPQDVTEPVELGMPSASYWVNVDVLVVSPGIDLAHPAIQQARASNVEILGDIELFARISSSKLVGITGSNGKTTVTLLLTHILKVCGLNTVAAGNVGKPVLEIAQNTYDYVVLELSSFQLESTHSLKLDAAALLNLSDDHLDRHKTMSAYLQAKQKIFTHCKQAVVWRGHPETYPIDSSIPVTTIGVDASTEGFAVDKGWITYEAEPLLEIAKLPLVGAHNILNVQAALGLAKTIGLPRDEAAEAVYSFIPAPHRCTQIALHNGVSWIDDSKATNVGATQAAITGIGAIKSGKLILIAGGDGKGADLTALKPAIEQFVDYLITLGKDGKQIASLTPCSTHVASMFEAVQTAHELACQDDIVLLSPACASLDMFDNYEHRAKVFDESIRQVVA
ncbi:UDP-N-acetylmuramoyl-L-alanine--D-glutamate ligase [Alteromonas sp. ASW11-130]|uniref:UDP-N-acetylmuramoyl-L-alanine--D-glutamate ligase n=1 Tax=Alteromonas sp. ASW11-130 TaxID=3015775 RepID=UPI00224246D3|nr:UDP-N-acetylmuramoyl-L-alanine--D-glutamate ligase [Alteromonas sp. ASW11-130]MCW8091629.1 UDP-N-acetylmuramoyl-L-alanine--D-glutamate ligase [Alteromonas sp. ASW11-130]